MDHRGTEVTSCRNLLNGLVTAATRSWRHGLQPNGHTSNAMVFPTDTTAANTSPTSRTFTTEATTMADDQRRRLQQQRHQDHRLNVLWYGGDDLHQQPQQQTPSLIFESHNRYQSTDDWEKQPLRQRQRKTRKLRCRRDYKEKRPALPRVPVIWAAILQAMYATAMAAMYYVYGTTNGSGWTWFKGTVGNSGSLFFWLLQMPPTWFYLAQAFCAMGICCFWYQWCSQQQQQQQQRIWCYYVLLALFSTSLFPSMPLSEVFDSGFGITTIKLPLENSTMRQQPENYSPNDYQIALYKGLWQVTFFIFVAYCLVLPMDINKKLDGENHLQCNKKTNLKKKDEESYHVTVAVLLFTIIASVGHTSLNAFIAYQWYFKKHHHQDKSIKSMTAIQQLIANVVLLTCFNLIGWLLRQSVVKDRTEIKSYESNNKFNHQRKELRFALRQQADKLNLLLASLLPKRVFSEMKYDIVADAARSCNAGYSSSDDDYQNEPHLQRPQQELQLRTPRLPRMYLKEYENISVVCANITGFWDNVSTAACHGESGSIQSCQFIMLVDLLLADLFRKLAYRNHCLPIRVLGHRIFFVAGLPTEESYGYNYDDEYKNSKTKMDDNGHARCAIQLGLDLIDAINMIAHDVRRQHYSHKINLNLRVGVHSGRIACGVLGFTGGKNICSDFGSRWQYEMWGRDVLMASDIESNGRPGWVHVSQATVDNITKKSVSTPGKNLASPGVIFRNKSSDSSNYKDDFTFERGHNHHQINTYFVVPNLICTNSEMNGNPVMNHDNDDNSNHYREDIESLIIQSIKHQLHREEMRRQQVLVNLIPKTEMMSEQLSTSTTTAVAEVSVMAASLVPAAPASTVKMIMNRHRRSRYEQESLQATNSKNNTSLTMAKENHCRWEEVVFGGYSNDNHDNIGSKSDDDDLSRLAKSQLLLLCVIITLFVVNITTMPWTMLLGITFITPFIVTAGELIYVMAVLIGWISRPRFQSTTYTAAIIADDDEFYHHYDSDNNDSDSYSSSDGGDGFLSRLTTCNSSNSCSLLEIIFKSFRCGTNNMVTTRSPPDNNDRRWWCFAKWCRCCHKHHRWFSWCLSKNGESTWMSSDDSDIESRLGFRNEHAVLATAGMSPPQQELQNRPHNSQLNDINSNLRTRRIHPRHIQMKRKYQDEERHTWFFWLAACSEVFVVLLICLLALLNAFTCEPVAISGTNTHNTIENNNGEFSRITLNTTQQQLHHSPLTCPWPQYVVLTCCLACVSIAIAFPIYYGSLPTLRIKIGMLFIMTFVFAVAFVHFTHRHVFHAASISSLAKPCCKQISDNFNNQSINNTAINKIHLQVRRDLHNNQQLLEIHNQEHLRVAGLDTATTTIYVVTFAMAMLIYFVYAHHLKDRLAYHRVKNDCYVRRLRVLRTAHQRTLRTILPDHVANLLLNSFCNNNANVGNDLCNRIQKHQNNTSIDSRSIPITINHDSQVQEQIPVHISKPLYHCGYRSVVIVFATIIQDQILSTTTTGNESKGHHCYRQLALLHDIFSEFDRLLDNQKFYGLVEKIKMIGTNTYMIAVGLQHQHGPEREMLMQLREMKRRHKESCNGQNKKSNIDSYNSRSNIDNELSNGYELYDVISANYIIFALDFIRDMRRTLHLQQTAVATTVANSHISQPTKFTLRVGVNVGPVVAGIIGCNDKIWKQPKFDVWGNTVGVARQMDITGIPGSTQVTNCVVDVMKSIKDPKYEFDIRTKITNKDNKRITYFVKENFDRNESHQSVQQLQLQQNAVVHKNHYLDSDRQQCKLSSTARSPLNVHRTTAQQLDPNQSPSRPVVTVYPQHTYYNAMIQQELRQKCLESQKKPPPPPPTRSPPLVDIQRSLNAPYPVLQHQYNEEQDQYSEQRQRSRGIQKQRTPDTTMKPEVTYARPLQQHQKQNNNQHSKISSCAPVPRCLAPIFVEGLKLPSPTATNSKICVFNLTADGKQQRLCRPNVLPLVNTTTEMTTVKNFDANRPLPAPPRSSDTVAGRQRQHHEPRRRRRLHHNKSSTTKQQVKLPQQQTIQPDVHGPSQIISTAWPSSSSFRSPVSAGSFVSVSSRPSSLSSSGSTDAGNTTTSNNNYNTTTTASSSSDESFSRTTTEDCGIIDRGIDTEDFDTAASSAAVSPVHQRYRHQQNLVLRQWSPSTTATSSPVRRSSSFRSPALGSSIQAGDITGPSSSSLRSPQGHSTTAICVGGTQSLNRRSIRPANTTFGGGGSSGRRRRRRQQQQQNNACTTVHSTSPLGDVPDVIDTDVNTTIVATETSPPLSPRKKQQQRRQVTTKDQGTNSSVTSPDFTDEIRRILLLDQHRGNIQHQLIPFEEQNTLPNNEKIAENVAKQESLIGPQQHQTILDVKGTTTSEESNKHEDKIRTKNHDIDPAAIVVSTTVLEPNLSFKERERQITEQVKRQEAEVMRILQAHKNNLVSVVRGVTDSGLHGRRPRVMVEAATTMVESSEWSDDESVEPLSLLDDRHGELHPRLSDYEENGSLVIGGDHDGYTTGADGDGYTTTDYTTDEAAATTRLTMNTNLPPSSARHLDDNLSTMNDTGLTDAEAALSDVNSLIDFNDGNDSNRFGSRRQSSLSSNSVCPYASDSFCDDDDDDYNDDGELVFQDEYEVEDEKLDSCDDDDFNSRQYNLNRLLQQQQLFLSQPVTLPLLSDTCTSNNNKRLQPQQLQQSQQTTTSQTSVNNTTINITQRPGTDTITAATTATSISVSTSTSMANSSSSNKSIAATSVISPTTITTFTNTKLDD